MSSETDDFSSESKNPLIRTSNYPNTVIFAQFHRMIQFKRSTSAPCEAILMCVFFIILYYLFSNAFLCWRFRAKPIENYWTRYSDIAENFCAWFTCVLHGFSKLISAFKFLWKKTRTEVFSTEKPLVQTVNEMMMICFNVCVDFFFFFRVWLPLRVSMQKKLSNHDFIFFFHHISKHFVYLFCYFRFFHGALD